MVYHLSYDGATATVDSMGGEMLAYCTKGGVSCLWNGVPQVWAGHSPHLFPIIGTLRNGTYQHRGRDYPMTKHGFLRGTSFTVVEQSERAITLLREETEDSLRQFPFAFSFLVTHTLTKSGFQTQYSISNRAAMPMPFCVGGHPALLCPVFGGEDFSHYQLELVGLQGDIALCSHSDEPLSPTSRVALPIRDGVLPLSHALLGDSVLIFENTGCHSVTLRSRQTAYSARLSFKDFPNFALWTFGTKSAGYICIEPWHGLPCMTTDGNGLEDKPYCIVLEPGAQRTLGYSVDFE